MKICLCLFVKNEQQFIAGALSNIGSFDDCFVIDYGSTDDTAKIARKKGAHVYYIPEFIDHADALQSLIEIARERGNDWLFRLDGDEMFVTLDRMKLDSWTNDRVNSVSFRRLNLTSATTFKKSWWPDVQHRGLRLDQRIEVVNGPIHAVPTMGGGPIENRADNLLVQSCQIHHFNLLKPAKEIDLKYVNYGRLIRGEPLLDKLPEGHVLGSTFDISDSQPIL